MKVTCDQHKLREGLAIANTVIPAKSARPVLENVCLVATDQALELVGMDTEVSVRYRIDDVDVTEPGPVLIPARVASDFVRDLTGDKVELSTEDGVCTIRCGEDNVVGAVDRRADRRRERQHTGAVAIVRKDAG